MTLPTFGPVAIPLVGEQIVLDPVEESHFEGLGQIALDPDIWTWMLNAPPVTPQDFRVLFDQMLEMRANGSQMPFIISSKMTGQILGATRLFDFKPADRGVEIGYTWYGASARGTGVNQSAKLLLLTHCFDGLLANRVQLKTDARNTRSRRAIEKIGGQLEGVLRSYQARFDGSCRDTAMFSITREDWDHNELRLRDSELSMQK